MTGSGRARARLGRLGLIAGLRLGSQGHADIVLGVEDLVAGERRPEKYRDSVSQVGVGFELPVFDAAVVGAVHADLLRRLCLAQRPSFAGELERGLHTDVFVMHGSRSVKP
jgi:hypothetical protein